MNRLGFLYREFWGPEMSFECLNGNEHLCVSSPTEIREKCWFFVFSFATNVFSFEGPL